MKEERCMIILKIKNKIGYFRKNSNDEWETIDKIDKDGLMTLLNIYMNSGEDIDMDSYEQYPIANPAQNIIYKNIFDKFSHLVKNKNTFKDASDSVYWAEIQKYQVPETDDF